MITFNNDSNPSFLVFNLRHAMVSRIYNVLMALSNLMHFQMTRYMTFTWGAFWMVMPLGALSLFVDLFDSGHGLRPGAREYAFLQPIRRVYQVYAGFVFIICLISMVVYYNQAQDGPLLRESFAWILIMASLWLFPKMNHQLYTYFICISRFLQAYIVCGVIVTCLTRSKQILY